MGDRYTITDRVDQGGMAEVFRGVAESLQGFKKNVAIKRILPNLTKNKKFVAMFLDEARLSLHLQHANVVHVFDIGKGEESTYFIVMEFVDGLNLKGLIEHHKKHGGRLKIAHSLYVLLEVCKGLAYAHDMADPETGKPFGIVHRDISPPNILLSKTGEVKIVDFGLAKATSQIETTDPGVVKGKFSYLSPEAASGLEVDHRADVFAVGILLWEMLSGRRLFFGDTDYQTVELVRQARIPSLTALNPEVHPELEQVVLKALARDPNQRFQSAADLQDAIAQHLFSRNLKVTSRDIAGIVKEAVSERDRGKPKSGGRTKTALIDVLIMEEIAKFTSLDDLGPTDISASGQKPLSPEEVGGSSSPLDPGSFVDPRAWSADTSTDARAVAARPVVSSLPRNPARAAGGQGAQARAGASGRPAAGSDIDSLQQILEPDRTGSTEGAPGRPDRFMFAVVAVFLVAVALGGGLFLFKDRLFGKPSASPPPAEPAVQPTVQPAQ